jgi:CHAT domain-containing protein
MGLARGFLGAGAGTVIGSLFPIEEDQALEFMKIFYGELLGPRRLSPAAALRAAQLQMLERPRFRHPFFWSAFVVIGDPR